MIAHIPELVSAASGVALLLLRKRIGSARVALLSVVWLLAADSSLPTLQYVVYFSLPRHLQDIWYFKSRGIPVLLLLLAGALIVFTEWRDEKAKMRPGCCSKCGYDLTGNISGVCPECGLKLEQGQCNR